MILALTGLLLAACGGEISQPTPAEPPAAEEAVPSPTAAPTAESEPPSVPPPSEELSKLRSGAWQWTALTNPEGPITIEAPEQYVVVFNDDGSIRITADCNTVLGQHVPSDAGELAITPGPATLAACPPESRGEQFVSLLSSAVRYFFDDDRLFIDLLADGGTMEFAPTGDATSLLGPTSEPPAAGLIDIVGNLTYEGPFPGGSITLTRGQATYDDGGTGSPYVRLIDTLIVTGDLDADGDQDAVTLLDDNSSGSGRFVYLAAVLDVLGNPQPTNLVMLGDRIGVKSVSVEGATITTDLISQGPGDAACCASWNVRKVLDLAGGELIERSSEELSRISVADLNGTSWRLVGFNGLLEPVPTDYTITAQFGDGQIAGLAACNNYSGSISDVEATPGGVIIGPLAVTQKACEDPYTQAEQRYLAALESVYNWLWGQEPGYLSLGYELEDGSIGQLVFEPVTEIAGETTIREAITVVPFDLGEAVLEQAWMGAGPMRQLPVRLNGMIAVPPEGDNLPLAVLIHGSHGSGCSSEDGVTEAWPCPEQEKRHYEGFAYLLEALAQQGYVAMAINANPIYLMAFGEANTPQRAPVLFDLYMDQIGAAVRGESNDFGVDLAGRVDLAQLVILGHSQGGAAVDAIMANRAGNTTTEAISAGRGRPVAVFLLAPAGIVSPDTPLGVPAAVLLPACDRDLATLEGQTYYEREQRLADQQNSFISILLRQANHNRFNSGLPDDELAAVTTACQPDMLLAPTAQRDFLAAYLPQFFDYALGRGGNAAALGLDASQPAPSELLGRAVLTSLALPAAQRLPIPLLPAGVIAPATAIDCPAEFTTEDGRLELCRYQGFTQPGTPEQVSVRWDGPGGALSAAVPEGSRDLTGYQTVHLRAALDPLSELNVLGQSQSFSLRLVDGAGTVATVALSGEPALAYPPGSAIFFGDQPDNLVWDAPILLSSVRVPLALFAGVDLGDIASIDLVFDQTDSGALFIADLELLHHTD